MRVEEISRITYDTNETRYGFNLVGHGCIIMGQTVDDLKGFTFIKRPMPEKLLDQSMKKIKINKFK